MRFVRWCGRATVAVLEWMAVFVVLADLAFMGLQFRGTEWVFVRLYGPFIGSFFVTVWLRRRLRARRASKTALRGQEGAKQ